MNEYMEKIIELSKELALQEERSRTLAARLDVANENLKEAKAHAAELEQSLLFRTEQHEAAVKDVWQACEERDEAIKRAQNLEAKLKGTATADLQAENDELRAHVAALEQSLAARAEQYEAAAWEAGEARRERNEARTELEIERKKRQELEQRLAARTDLYEASMKEIYQAYSKLNARSEHDEQQHKDLLNRAVAQYECLEKIEGLVSKLVMDSPCAPHAVCVGIVRKEG